MSSDSPFTPSSEFQSPQRSHLVEDTCNKEEAGIRIDRSQYEPPTPTCSTEETFDPDVVKCDDVETDSVETSRQSCLIIAICNPRTKQFSLTLKDGRLVHLTKFSKSVFFVDASIIVPFSYRLPLASKLEECSSSPLLIIHSPRHVDLESLKLILRYQSKFDDLQLRSLLSQLVNYVRTTFPKKVDDFLVLICKDQRSSQLVLDSNQALIYNNTSSKFMSRKHIPASTVRKPHVALAPKVIQPIVYITAHFFMLSHSTVHHPELVLNPLGGTAKLLKKGFAQVGKGRLLHCTFELSESVDSYNTSVQLTNGRYGRFLTLQQSPHLFMKEYDNFSWSELITAMGDLVNCFHHLLTRDDMNNLLGKIWELSRRASYYQRNFESEKWALQVLFTASYYSHCASIIKRQSDLAVVLSTEDKRKLLDLNLFSPGEALSTFQDADVCSDSYVFDYIRELFKTELKSENNYQTYSVYGTHSYNTGYGSATHHSTNTLSTFLPRLKGQVLRLLSRQVPQRFLQQVFNACLKYITSNSNVEIDSQNVFPMLQHFRRNSAIEGLLFLFSNTPSYPYEVQQDLVPVFELVLSTLPSELPTLLGLSQFRQHSSSLSHCLSNISSNVVIKSLYFLTCSTNAFDEVLSGFVSSCKLSSVQIFESIFIPNNSVSWNKSPQLLATLLSLVPSFEGISSLTNPIFPQALRVLINSSSSENLSIYHNFSVEFENSLNNSTMSFVDIIYSHRNSETISRLFPIQFGQNISTKITQLHRKYLNLQSCLHSLSNICQAFGVVDEHITVTTVLTSLDSSTTSFSDITFHSLAPKTITDFIHVVCSPFAGSSVTHSNCTKDTPSRFNVEVDELTLRLCESILSTVLFDHFVSSSAAASVHQDEATEGQLPHLQPEFFSTVAQDMVSFVDKLGPSTLVSFLQPWMKLNASQMTSELKSLAVAFGEEKIQRLKDYLFTFVCREQWLSFDQTLAQLPSDFPLRFTRKTSSSVSCSTDSLSLQQLVELKSQFSVGTCRFCDLVIPAPISILSCLLKCSNVLRVLAYHQDTPIESITSVLVSSFSDWISGDRSLQFFVDQLRDSQSLWNFVIRKSLSEPIEIANFLNELHSWTHQVDLVGHSVVETYCSTLEALNLTADQIHKLLEAGGDFNEIVHLLSNSNYRQGTITLSFAKGEVSLSYNTDTGPCEISPENFKEARSAAILYQSNAETDEGMLDRRAIRDLIDLCTFCSQAVESSIALRFAGFDTTLVSISKVIPCMQMSQFVSSLEQMHSEWKTIVAESQSFVELVGITGSELFRLLIGQDCSQLVQVFPGLKGKSSFPLLSSEHLFENTTDTLRSRFSLLSSKCSRYNPPSSKTVSIYHVSSAQKLFMGLLQVSSISSIQLSITNVLMCSNQIVPDSVEVFLRKSATGPCFLFSPERLSAACSTVLTGRLNSDDFRGTLYIITASSVIQQSLTSVQVIELGDRPISLPCPQLVNIFRSDTPGQGKTTKGLQKCGSQLFSLSGSIKFKEIIKAFHIFEFTSSKPLLIDIQEPLDVLKRKFDMNSFNTKYLDSDFFDLAITLFSLIFLSGLRFDGDTFFLSRQVCLEVPSIDTSIIFDWVTLLLNLVLPSDVISDRSFVCSFDANSVVPTLLTCSPEDYHVFVSALQTVSNNSAAPASSIFSLNLNSFTAPHSSLWSYRLLNAIVCITSRQLSHYNSSVYKLCTDFGQTVPQLTFLSLILGFSRQAALLSLHHGGGNTIISWQNTSSVQFVFASCDSFFVFAPPNVGLPRDVTNFYSALDPGFKKNAKLPTLSESDMCINIRSFASPSRDLAPLVAAFPDFTMTEDCFRKQIIIVTRLLSNLPVILQGSAGVGKTYLLRHLVFNLFRRSDCLEELCFNAGTSLSDLYDCVTRVNTLAQKVTDPLFPVLFLDEVNASDHLHHVTSLFTNRRIGKVQLDAKVRLVCAINPFTLSSSGAKIFNVYDTPPCLRTFIMDFGSLSQPDEEAYIKNMAMGSGLSPEVADIASRLLPSLHSQLRSLQNTSWMVSLRDVVRCLKMTSSLNKLTSNSAFKLWTKSRSPAVHCFGLAVYVCYVARPPDKNIRQRVLATLNSATSASRDYYFDTMKEFASKLSIPDGIVLNTALVENLFALFCGILSKVATIIIGVPGQSKSLSLTLLLSFLSKTVNRVSYLPQVHTTAYQGSRSATSESLLRVVDSVVAKSSTNDSSVHCLVMDELSLMMDAPANPLKALHSVLEPKNGLSFAFIGISNSEFDAAPTSRAVIVQREAHSKQELVETMKELCSDKHAKILVEVHTKLQQLSKLHFSSLLENSNLFGNRDVYALGKFYLDIFTNHKPRNSFGPLFLRCYGGLPLSSDTSLFSEYNKLFNKLCGSHLSKITYQRQLEEALESNLVDFSPTARHLLLIGPHSRALQLLRKSKRAIDLEPLIGSKYEQDGYRDYAYHQLSRILTACAQGKVIVLQNQDNLIGALFDLLNRNYLRFDHKGVGVARVALGNTGNRLAQVHQRTRVIVVCSSDELCKQPPALLNRLEKINIEELSRGTREEVQYWTSLCKIAGLETVKCFNIKSLAIELADAREGATLLLSRLLVPSEVVKKSSSDLQKLQRVVSFYGFLNLYDIITDSRTSHASSPLRLVVCTNYIGSRVTSLPFFSSVVYTVISSAKCHEELDDRLRKDANKCSQGSLLLIQLVEKEVEHFEAASHIIQTSSAFSNIDIVFVILKGCGATISLSDGYNVYFADSLHVEYPSVTSVNQIFSFNNESIPPNLSRHLISSTMMFSLFKHHSIPDRLVTSAYKFLNEISRNPTLNDHVTSILSQMIVQRLPQTTASQASFMKTMASYPASSLQESLHLYSQDITIMQLSFVLYDLCSLQVLEPVNYDVSVYFQIILSVYTNILATSSFFSPILKSSWITPSSSKVPFVNLIAKILHYLLNNDTDNFKLAAQRLPDLLGEEFSCFVLQLDVKTFIWEILITLSLGSSPSRTQLESLTFASVYEVFEFIGNCLENPLRRLIQSCEKCISSLGIGLTSDCNATLWTLLGILLTIHEPGQDVLSMFNSVVLLNPPTNDAHSRIVLDWIRLYVLEDFSEQLVASCPLTSMDSLLTTVGFLSQNTNEVTVKLLSMLLQLLPIDLLLNAELYADFCVSAFDSLYFVIIRLLQDMNNSNEFQSPLVICGSLSIFGALFDSCIDNSSLLEQLSLVFLTSLTRFANTLSYEFDQLVELLTCSSSPFDKWIFVLLFTVHLEHALKQNEPLPFSVFELSLLVSDSLLAPFSNILRSRLLLKTTPAQVDDLISGLINSSNMTTDQKSLIFSRLNWKQSNFDPFVKDTDWLESGFLVCPQSQLCWRRDFRLLLSLKGAKNLESYSQLPSSFCRVLDFYADCKHLLTPFAEFVNSPLAASLLDQPISECFIVGNLPNNSIGCYYIPFSSVSFAINLSNNVEYNTINYCPNCFYYARVDNCGSTATDLSEFIGRISNDTVRNDRVANRGFLERCFHKGFVCPTCGTPAGNFQQNITFDVHNQHLIATYKDRKVMGPILFNLSYIENNALDFLTLFFNFSIIEQLLELLALQLFSYLFSFIINPQTESIFDTAFNGKGQFKFLAHIRDSLVSIYSYLAGPYNCSPASVPFILFEKVRRISQLPINLFCRTWEEKVANECRIFEGLSGVNQRPNLVQNDLPIATQSTTETDPNTAVCIASSLLVEEVSDVPLIFETFETFKEEFVLLQSSLQQLLPVISLCSQARNVCANLPSFLWETSISRFIGTNSLTSQSISAAVIAFNNLVDLFTKCSTFTHGSTSNSRIVLQFSCEPRIFTKLTSDVNLEFFLLRNSGNAILLYELINALLTINNKLRISRSDCEVSVLDCSLEQFIDLSLLQTASSFKDKYSCSSNALSFFSTMLLRPKLVIPDFNCSSFRSSFYEFDDERVNSVNRKNLSPFIPSNGAAKHKLYQELIVISNISSCPSFNENLPLFDLVSANLGTISGFTVLNSNSLKNLTFTDVRFLVHLVEQSFSCSELEQLISPLYKRQLSSPDIKSLRSHKSAATVEILKRIVLRFVIYDSVEATHSISNWDPDASALSFITFETVYEALRFVSQK
ncbi:hypothetical protein RCL1_005702 [Eukaryota sp. TZLM3-RCL]